MSFWGERCIVWWLVDLISSLPVFREWFICDFVTSPEFYLMNFFSEMRIIEENANFDLTAISLSFVKLMFALLLVAHLTLNFTVNQKLTTELCP